MRTEYLIHIRTIIIFSVVLILSGLFSVFFLRESFDRKKREKCYRDMVVFAARVAKNIPDNAVIFVGDSLVQGLCVAAVTPYGVNLGIGRDTTSGVLRRIKQYRSMERAKAVIVAVGANDLIQGLQKGIVERYNLILQAIPVHVPIILCEILPIDEKATQKISNNDILLLNRSLTTVCSKRKNCYSGKFTKKLIDYSGNLSSKYHVGDGIHLNSQGYRLWIKQMKNILMEI